MICLVVAALHWRCQVYDPGLLASGSAGGVSPPGRDATPAGGPSCGGAADLCQAGAAGEGGGGAGGASGNDGHSGDVGVGGDPSSEHEAGVSDGSGSAGDSTGTDDGGTCAQGPSGCTPDAADLCPDDPFKSAPGMCGCGKSEADRDGDGVADCLDGCPTDPQKSAPRQCGCNLPEPPTGNVAFCLKALMVHRYGFNGAGTTLLDTVGTAHGTATGGANAVQASGALSLSGNTVPGYGGEGFGALPANLLAGLTDATFEAWVTWRGAGSLAGTAWQRVFDFGDQIASGNGTLRGNSYLFLTTSAQAGTGTSVRASYQTADGQNQVFVDGSGALPTGVKRHVVVVFDDTNRKLSLYVEGALVGSVALASPLSAINNAHSWLGRSGYQVDPELNGSFDEFRIYRVALTAAQVRTSFEAGPDASELR